MLRSFGFPVQTQPLFLFTQDADLKASGAYLQAKAGHEQAAVRLLMDLAVSWLYEHRDRFEPGLIFLAPHASEASGDNAIPQALATVCALMFQGTVDNEIVQSDRVFHTGADPMERMAARAQFEGVVISGAKYVLVDDVTNLGGTLAELSNYVQIFGGVVHDVVVLVNAGRDKSLVPSKKFVQLIKERFDDEFTEVFGIEPSALTANEANYLVGFTTIDGIRNRLAAAQQEIDRRLRSKGIARTAQGQASGASAAAGLIQNSLEAGDPAS
ncbi:conjugal transfer protein TraN [Limnohabitans sp. G3-2]|jgi:orotate phosphoribosyltransferase|uniref:conjugal transfer protein TraN n=1 Tax=Limnohabitans sp. G3-2 TaxID=1100711 RepID=UPI0018EE1916|nr:conjugal transfer protein TraN [Limnohabitans sp. G3-2]